MNKITTARLDANNIRDLRTLYRSVYNKDCGASYFPLKYDTAYTGAQYTGYLAYSDGIPVAYYGVVPTLVSIKQKPVLAAQSCDTMTHPAYRKQGWFVKLAQMIFLLAKQEGIHFVFGFPNQHSYPGFIKHLGFLHQETMNRYAFRFPSNLFNKLYFRTWKTLGSKSTAAPGNPLVKEGFDGVIYSPEWHKYKQYSKSMLVGTPLGQAWVKPAHGLWIGSVDLSLEKDMQSLIRSIAKITKTPAITLMVSPGTAFNRQLEEISQPQKAFAVITKNLSNVHQLDGLKFQLSDIDIF